MQGQRSIFDPFPETVDLNQGSTSNTTGMDESEDWNNILSPIERRLLNNDLSSELNFSCVNTSGHHNSRGFGGWDIGESSSRANLPEQVANDGLKVERSWSPSFVTHDSRLEEQQLETSNIHPRDSFSGGQVAVGPLNLQNSGSNRIPLDVNLNVGYGGNNGDDGGHGLGLTNLYKSGRPQTEAGTSSAGIGTSSDCGSDSSLGSWGLSCKRKALEGTSGQSLAAGSSSCIPQAENIVRHTVPGRYNASSSLSISSPLANPLAGSRQEQLNTRIGVGMRGAVASDAFPHSSLPGVPESSQRHFGMRDSVPFSISSTGSSTRRSNISSSHQQSRRLSLSEFLEHTSRGPLAISGNSSNPSNQQPPVMHVPGMPRNVLPFPWNGNINSRNGSSSSSAALPGERGAEANFRSTLRNNMHHHSFVPSSETRNLVQDPTNWSLATGGASTTGGGTASSSRTGTGSRPFNAVWMSHPNSTTPSQQRLSELPPWTLFPSADAESSGQRGHFPPFPSGSSSTSEENLISSGVNSQGHHHQPYSRSALLMEVPSDDWRALAADIEGRQRLVSEIRQVLNAMRRGENLRAEDYMLFDPFINGVAELHDRHRDMRLDVDNMSYEELLALEERIGNVNTGLSDETILKSMKQRKHIAFMAVSTTNLEPCCICQEEYDTGDDIGTLDCGHDFHTDCIKQWLAQKNLCPICKMTALAT